MRRIVSVVLIPVVVALAECAHPSSPYVAGLCPLPPAARGFPLTASSSDTTVDVAFLRAVTRAIAGQWDTHPDRRVTAAVPRAVKALGAALDRGATFARHDWTPLAADTARLLVVYRRGFAPEIHPASSSKPTRAEAMLRAATTHAIERTRDGEPVAEPLPLAPPAGGGDSLSISIVLGREPDARSGVARFSVQERTVRPMSRNVAPDYPRGSLTLGIEGDVMLAFVVRPDSTPDVSTAQVIRSTNVVFSAAALRALDGYRFAPAEIDCVLVPELVEQPFTFRIGRPRASASTPSP